MRAVPVRLAPRLGPLLLAPTLLVAACASASAPADSRSARATDENVFITSVDGSVNADVRLTRDDRAYSLEVPAAREVAWERLPEAFTAVGLPEPQLDEARWAAVVSNHLIRRRLGERRLSRLLECGRGITQPHADTHRVHLAVVSWLEESGEGASLLHTRVEAMAENPEGTTAAVRCSSRGELERVLGRALQLAVLDG